MSDRERIAELLEKIAQLNKYALFGIGAPAASVAKATKPLWKKLMIPATLIAGTYGLGRYQGYNKGKADTNDDNYGF